MITGAEPAPRCDVRELEGDEASTHEQHTSGPFGEVEELGAVDEMLGSREIHRPWFRPGSDQESLRLVRGAVDDDPVGVGERRCSMECFHAAGAQTPFHGLGNRVGEAVLVCHQVGPVDGQPVVVDAFAAHQSGGIDDLRAAAQDLLGVTSTQRACAPIRQSVDDRYPPTTRGALLGGGDTSHAGTDHDQVEGLTHLNADPALPGCTPIPARVRWVRWVRWSGVFEDGVSLLCRRGCATVPPAPGLDRNCGDADGDEEPASRRRACDRSEHTERRQDRYAATDSEPNSEESRPVRQATSDQSSASASLS
jgi:hypothetical protein